MIKRFIYKILGIRFCPKCGHKMYKTVEFGMKVIKCSNCKSFILR